MVHSKVHCSWNPTERSNPFPLESQLCPSGSQQTWDFGTTGCQNKSQSSQSGLYTWNLFLKSTGILRDHQGCGGNILEGLSDGGRLLLFTKHVIMWSLGLRHFLLAQKAAQCLYFEAITPLLWADSQTAAQGWECVTSLLNSSWGQNTWQKQIWENCFGSWLQDGSLHHIWKRHDSGNSSLYGGRRMRQLATSLLWWLMWEMSPTDTCLEYLVPSCWGSLRSFRKCSLTKGSASLATGWELWALIASPHF